MVRPSEMIANVSRKWYRSVGKDHIVKTTTRTDSVIGIGPTKGSDTNAKESLSLQVYRHAPLQQQDSMRLLHLLCGPPGSPLTCHIVEYSNNHEVLYTALSYTWDAPLLEHSITIVSSTSGLGPRTQAARKLIGRNLFEALQALRSESQPVYLWVDAICIDQSNLEEKGHQVAHMGQIYREAYNVVIWLGTGTAKMISAFKTLLLYPDPYCERMIVWPLDIDYNDPEARNFDPIPSSDRDSKILDSLDDSGFLALPWFSRIWTIQEYVLGKTVTFQLGSFQCPAKPFHMALHHFQLAISHDTERMETQPYHNSEAVVRIEMILNLFRFRVKYHQKPKPNARASQEISLTRCVLELGRWRDCTDERDRIYGMLGMSHDLAIEPDYNLSVHEVYTDFAKRSLSSGDASILHKYAVTLHNRTIPFYLAPLSHPNPVHVPICTQQSSFRAGHRYRARFRFHDNVMSTKGVIVDTIERRVLFSDSHGFTSSTIPQIPLRRDTRRLFRAVVNHLLSPPIPTSESIIGLPNPGHGYVKLAYPQKSIAKVFIRTMLLDSEEGYGKGMPWLRLKHSEAVRLSTQSLFLTSKGYLGLGTQHLQPGDKIVIFDGTKTPFIVRADTTADRIWSNRYNLVGDCYLHGWMYGDYNGRRVLNDQEASTKTLWSDNPALFQSVFGVDSHLAWDKDVRASIDTILDKKILHKQTFVIC